MPRDMEAFGGLVAMAVKSALAPVLERVAGLEAQNAALRATVAEHGSLRDRLVVLETQHAAPVVPDTDLRDRVLAFAPLPERVAGVEALLSGVPRVAESVAQIRDRLVVLETKAARPPEAVVDPSLVARLSAAETQLARAPQPDPDITDVRTRMAELEARQDEGGLAAADLADYRERVLRLEAECARLLDADKTVGDVKDRVLVLETKASTVLAPVVPDTGLRERLGALEHKLTAVSDALTGDLTRVAKRLDDVDVLHRDLPILRERIAVAEVRAFTPGPAGAPGRDGVDGKDGQDGVGWDQLALVQDTERSFIMTAAHGERVKTVGTVKFPFLIHKDTWTARPYERGDAVTWGGSTWHCVVEEAAATDKPGESKSWRLIVKRGNDGKDGKDAGVETPVVRLR